MIDKPNRDWTRDNSPKHWWQWPGITELLVVLGAFTVMLAGYAGLYWMVWGRWPAWS
ncbi:hypothetical protein PBI_SMARTIES_2 [Microbacterium phage Smarties]|uniref:Uncharacterized protein n=1 Tax=Microbacterium phage Ariadne TaxID=2656546 RepID=A0A649VAN4_9CAUD|nr:hypothetical protein QDA10_gp002 [Microbacterium phage Ariadne]QGJ89407.1 hypothetical protein PBI_ARIADNE_2 [Microbacterium phage Ariadne]QGJ91394.1 hypothetical protein PBI_SMARTIES_2 [Microbacterium phage Smarties]